MIPVEVANRERFAMLRQLVDVVNAQLEPPSNNRICSSATVLSCASSGSPRRGKSPTAKDVWKLRLRMLKSEAAPP